MPVHVWVGCGFGVCLAQEFVMDEFNECWGRCWVDLGTSDLIAIDILINALKQMDVDVVKIEELIIGGVNQDWPVEEHPDAIFSSTD